MTSPCKSYWGDLSSRTFLEEYTRKSRKRVAPSRLIEENVTNYSPKSRKPEPKKQPSQPSQLSQSSSAPALKLLEAKTKKAKVQPKKKPRPSSNSHSAKPKAKTRPKNKPRPENHSQVAISCNSHPCSILQPSFNLHFEVPPPIIQSYDQRKDIFLGRALQFTLSHDCQLEDVQFYTFEEVLLDRQGKFVTALDKAFLKKTAFRVKVWYDVPLFMWKAIQAGFLKPELGGRTTFEDNSLSLKKYYVELQSMDVLKFIFKGKPLPRKYGDQEIRLYPKDKIKIWYEYHKGRLTLSVPICCFDEDINPNLPIWPLGSAY